jgi:hypothetical protein
LCDLDACTAVAGAIQMYAIAGCGLQVAGWLRDASNVFKVVKSVPSN